MERRPHAIGSIGSLPVITVMMVTLTVMVLGALPAGCSDGGETNGDDCSGAGAAQTPGCQLVTPDEAPATASGSANYTCLGKVTPPAAPTKDLIIRGKTQQRLSNGTDADQGGITVEVWTDQSKLDDGTRVAKTTSDSGTAEYEITIPASAWASASSKGVRVAWRISASDTIPTVEYNDPLPIADAKPDSKDPTKLALEDLNRITLKRSTLQTINGLLGTTSDYDKQKAIVLGVVRDCKRAEVANTSAGVVDASGEPVEGPLLFHFQNKFPVVRKSQPFSSDDGYFTLLNVPVGETAEVRVVGKLGGKPTVLSRQVLPVKSDTMVIADFDPLEEPLK
jgi:hypothetical protein